MSFKRNYDQIGMYHQLLEDCNDIDLCKKTIDEYITNFENKCIKNNVIINFIQFEEDFTKITYNKNNVCNYLDIALFLNLSSVDEFVNHLIKEYILKYFLLDKLSHYDIIQIKLENLDKTFIKRFGKSLRPSSLWPRPQKGAQRRSGR